MTSNHSPTAGPKRRRELGFSLIEVMVAVLVMALGMLGIAALQAAALRNNLSAYQRSQATIQAYTIIDAMRANRRLMANYVTDEFICQDTIPEETSLANRDLAFWVNSMVESLGEQACGRVNCTFPASGNPNDPFQCAIDVRWNDSRGAGDAAALEEFTMTTRAIL